MVQGLGAVTVSLSPKAPAQPPSEYCFIKTKYLCSLSALCNTWNSFQINNRIVAKKEPRKKWEIRPWGLIDEVEFLKTACIPQWPAAAGRLLFSSFAATVLGFARALLVPTTLECHSPFPYLSSPSSQWVMMTPDSQAGLPGGKWNYSGAGSKESISTPSSRAKLAHSPQGGATPKPVCS